MRASLSLVVVLPSLVIAGSAFAQTDYLTCLNENRAMGVKASERFCQRTMMYQQFFGRDGRGRYVDPPTLYIVPAPPVPPPNSVVPSPHSRGPANPDPQEVERLVREREARREEETRKLFETALGLSRQIGPTSTYDEFASAGDAFIDQLAAFKSQYAFELKTTDDQLTLAVVRGGDALATTFQLWRDEDAARADVTRLQERLENMKTSPGRDSRWRAQVEAEQLETDLQRAQQRHHDAFQRLARQSSEGKRLIEAARIMVQASSTR